MILLPAKRYNFRDEFYTSRAVGAVDGTACEGGPGLRTVTDTETCLSIIPKYGSSLYNQAGVTTNTGSHHCSFADGYAWADFPIGGDFSPHAGAGRILLLRDAAGAVAWGYIGAAGTGESLGSELNNDSSLEDDYHSEYLLRVEDPHTGTYAQQFTGVNADDNYSISLSLSDYLYKVSMWSKRLTGSTGNIKIGTIAIGRSSWLQSVRWEQYTETVQYSVNVTTVYYGYKTGTSAADTVVLDDFSVKQVLTPSATGVMIYRDAALTVNGWNKSKAFNMNSSSYMFDVYQPMTGGKLFFQCGKSSPVYGDPGYWKTEAITRAAGLILACRVNSPSIITKYIQLGLDDAKFGGINAVQIAISGSRWVYGATIKTAVVTAGYINTFTIALRANGFFLFFKANNEKYILVGLYSSGNTTTLYPGMVSYNAAFTADFLRIPRIKWLPTPLLSDGFTAADTTSNDGRTSDGAGHAETSGLGSGGLAVWSGASGSISGNKLVITPTLGEELSSGSTSVGSWYSITATEANYFYTDCAVGNKFRATSAKVLDANNKVRLITLASCINTVTLATTDIEIKIALSAITAGSQAGVIIGLDAGNTSFLLMYHDGTKVYTEICESGTYTNKNVTTVTYTANAELRVARRTQADGTSEIWVWFKNALIGTGPTTTLSASEASNTPGLRAGLFSTYEENTFDNCTIYAVGTNGEYDILDRIIGA